MVNDILHGWSHVERVLKYGKLVNKERQGDWSIIKSAILLHDIGHRVNPQNHNEISAQMAEKFLIAKGLDPQMISNITHCIQVHSRQYSELKPECTEAQVVFDADGMDLFGAIGLMRALLTCALRNEEFDCILKKLNWRLEQRPNFFSKAARQFVDENSPIIESYFRTLREQIELVISL